MKRLSEFTLADVFPTAWPPGTPRDLRILAPLLTHPGVGEVLEEARRREWRRWEREQEESRYARV